jgi:hypothetical protein
MSQVPAGDGSACPVPEGAEVVRPSLKRAGEQDLKDSPRSRRPTSGRRKFRANMWRQRRAAKFVWRNYQYRAPAKREKLTHLVVIWILLSSSVMACHVSGLQPVISLDAVSNSDAYVAPRYAATNAVVLLRMCRAIPQQVWPTDVCVWFTSGCVFMCVYHGHRRTPTWGHTRSTRAAQPAAHHPRGRRQTTLAQTCAPLV